MALSGCHIMRNRKKTYNTRGKGEWIKIVAEAQRLMRVEKLNQKQAADRLGVERSLLNYHFNLKHLTRTYTSRVINPVRRCTTLTLAQEVIDQVDADIEKENICFASIVSRIVNEKYGYV